MKLAIFHMYYIVFHGYLILVLEWDPKYKVLFN